jgi:SPX domain protein involved in polyphosphate accumulation
MKSRGSKKKKLFKLVILYHFGHIFVHFLKLVEIKIKITSHIPLIYFYSIKNKEQK